MKAVYLHQWNQMSERTPDEIDATFHGNFDEIRFKSHQYTTFTGYFDNGGAFDLYSEAKVYDCIDYWKSKGYVVRPWCVPMGIGVESEATIAARIAKRAGAIDLDIEPYAEFWPGIPNGDYSAVEPYLSRLRNLVGPSVHITMDMPFRNGHERRAMLPFVRVAMKYVDRIALQSYFGAAQAIEAELAVESMGWKGEFEHIVIPSQFDTMLPMIRDAKQHTMAVWHAPDMSPSAYAYMKSFDFGNTKPAPNPSPSIQWQEPGFAELAKKLGVATVGNPTKVAESNAWGDVRQVSDKGTMYWSKSGNSNWWVKHHA